MYYRVLYLLFLLSVSSPIYSDFIVSHKTAGLEYPENTLDGFIASLNMDVQAIEIDIHVTLDKQLVLHHDPVLHDHNCFNGNDHQDVVIAQTRLAELISIECINEKLEKPQPYQLPSLEDIFSLYLESDQTKQLLIEVKVLDKLIEHYPHYRDLDTDIMHYSDAEVADLLYAKIREFGLKDNIMFNTFSQSLLLELKGRKAANENFQFGLLYKGDYAPLRLRLFALLKFRRCFDFCWLPNYQEVAIWLTENEIDFFIPNYPQLSSFLFREAYQKHIDTEPRAFQVIPWTLNKEIEWEEAQNYLFDGIITDKPSDYLESFSIE